MHTNLAVSLSQQDTIRDLEAKLSEANEEITRLQKENERLKQQNRGSFGFMKNEK